MTSNLIMRNFAKRESAEVLTDLFLRTSGINTDDPYVLDANHLLPVVYDYPPHDTALYQLQPKPALTRMEHSFVQEFDVVPRELEDAKASMMERVTAKRWEVETGGVVLGGIEVQTGIDDQNRIATAIQGMAQAGLTSTDFKAVSGWVRVTLEQLKAIAAAIATHVEGCFKNERNLHELIDACETFDDLLGIDINAGWPEKVGATQEAE